MKSHLDSRKSRTSRRGVTRLELLLAAAVVATVSAILIPACAPARDKNNQATCAGNLKQLGAALLQYTQDFDGYLPSPYVMTNGTKTSFVLDAYLRPGVPHVGRQSVWNCPDQTIRETDYKQRSYILNGYLVGPGSAHCGPAGCGAYFTGNTNIVDPDSYYSRPSDDARGAFCYGAHPGGAKNDCTFAPVYYNDTPIAAATILSPAQTCMLFEALYQTRLARPATYRGYVGQVATDGDWRLAQGYYQGDPNAARDEASTWYPAFRPDRARHASLDNYLFCDGHVKARRPETYGYDITQHPVDNIWLTHDGRDGSPLSATPH